MARTSQTWAARVDFVFLASLSSWTDLVTPVFLLVKGFAEGLKVVLCSATLLFRSMVLPA